MIPKLFVASATVLLAVHTAHPAAVAPTAVQAPPMALRVQSLSDEDEGIWIRVPGYESVGSPAFSPGGEWIAFDAYEGRFGDNPAEVWIVRRDGSDLTRVTTGATPRWSPDGERLIFKRDDFSNPDAEPGIYVIHRDGSGERRIGEGRWPDWSPDGRRIAYSLGGEQSGGARVGAEVYVARADGSRPRRVALGDCPSWSPDAARLAVCQRGPDNEYTIKVVDLASGEETVLGTGAFRPNWSPEGDRVICHDFVRRPRQWRLVVAPADGEGEFEPLFEDQQLQVALAPCYAPDGEAVVFVAVPPEESE